MMLHGGADASLVGIPRDDLKSCMVSMASRCMAVCEVKRRRDEWVPSIRRALLGLSRGGVGAGKGSAGEHCFKMGMGSGNCGVCVLMLMLCVWRVQGCACGLLYLHCQVPPVVHRDVKPENFLMSAAGEVKVATRLCGLGSSRRLQSSCEAEGPCGPL